jgi:hypothetical protein
MIAPNLNRLCEQAKIYYYDFLLQKDINEIPEQITNHLGRCANCQKQIYELKTAINRAKFNSQDGRASSITPLSNMLKLHFSYVDHDVTCGIAKSFIPGLLDFSMQISIPTPITVHLDNCHECVQDLGKIRDLNLSEIHLYRLGRLFAAKPDDDYISCERAESDMMNFVMMTFHESDEQTLKHLCACRECRTAIYQYRETIREGLLRERAENSCFLSSSLSYDDVFDYTIPYGLDIEHYRKSESHLSRTPHIRRCPFCLEKIQELHRAVYEIAERPDSQIVTKYNVEKSSQTANLDDSNNFYAGFPVSVEVEGASRKIASLSAGSIINFTAALKKKILASNFKSISRTGVAGILIAAVLLTSMLFFSSGAKGITFKQLYNVFQRSNNVHIMSYTRDGSEPDQEIWISHSGKVEISKTGEEFVLFDVVRKTQTIKRPGSKPIPQPMSANQLADRERHINNSIDLLYSFSGIPAGWEWKEGQAVNEGTEIYELTWKPEFYVEPYFNKLVFFIDPDTNRPVRVEFCRKLAGENEFKIQSSKVIDYPDDKEIADKIMLFK